MRRMSDETAQVLATLEMITLMVVLCSSVAIVLGADGGWTPFGVGWLALVMIEFGGAKPRHWRIASVGATACLAANVVAILALRGLIGG